MTEQGNLDEAQQAAQQRDFQAATALALIDIGYTLRTIHAEMRDWDTYGLNVRKHTP